MNFILKNIWWIALFIFFAIMLLIISANQKDNLVTNKTLQDAKQELILTGSQAIESGSGVLTDLVKMLDDSEKIPEIKAEEKVAEVVVNVEDTMKDMKEDIVSNEATVKSDLDATDKKGAIASFFDRFKRDSSDKEIKEDDKTMMENESQDDMKKESDMEEEKPKADVVVVKKQVSAKKEYKKMQYKKGTFRDIPTYNGQFSVNQKPLPWINLKTAIGNTYKLGVPGLKLNNAHFNQSFGIMKKGDVVRQMTHENKYGCFKVEVLSGKIAGKNGYVCKKWFMAHKAPVKHVVRNVVSTKIGDIHSVAATQLKLNNKAFNTALTVMNKGDKLEQIGNENTHGCFQVRILTSKVANDIGKVGYVCKKYLSGHSWSVAAAHSNMTALQSYAMTRTTKMGDTHTVSAHSLKLNNAHFTKNLGYLSYGDTVKQLTVENTRGCFKVQVLSSRVSSSEGKLGFVCKKYLK